MHFVMTKCVRFDHQIPLFYTPNTFVLFNKTVHRKKDTVYLWKETAYLFRDTPYNFDYDVILFSLLLLKDFFAFYLQHLQHLSETLYG